jgi:hypothetical protein
MKLSSPPKLVEKLVWIPIIWFCKVFIPSYGFDALICRNWLFSPLLPDFTDNSIVCNKSEALLVQFFSSLKRNNSHQICASKNRPFMQQRDLVPTQRPPRNMKENKFEHPFFFLLPSLVEACMESW